MRGISSGTSVPAPERFDADPEPTFYFDADPEPTFYFDVDPEPTFYFDTDPAKLQSSTVIDKKTRILLFGMRRDEINGMRD